MQRIPNPGSDLDVFIHIFKDIHEVLHNCENFDLDDMTRAMIERNNVTSQGAIGEEALRRSTRLDRSRDPLYNQSKMYAELYRTLGWIHSTTRRLTYSFSFLGEHVAAAHDPNPLVRECLLGIAYPNEVLQVKTSQTVRVIGSILLAMDSLSTISRDELMAGPMSISDDTDNTTFSSMLRTLAECRKQPGKLNTIIESIAKKRGISRSPTMENYTRFPIAVFPWAGWATKKKGIMTITNEGQKMAARLRAGTDVRLNQFQTLPQEARPAFVRCTFFRMLERAGFNLKPVMSQVTSDINILQKYNLPHVGDVYFSPFQQLCKSTLESITPEFIVTQYGHTSHESSLLDEYGSTTRRTYKRATLLVEIAEAKAPVLDDHNALGQEIKTILLKNTPTSTIEILVQRYATANQDVFYPRVADAFCLLGFKCRTARRGVNYARADAMIEDEHASIPIEIKSPREESEISVKAVRQALENKIVLLSRKNYTTNFTTTALVVGFNAPNERSEVHELIEDIMNTFNIRIGIIDFRSLVTLVVHRVASERQLILSEFRNMKGLIRVKGLGTK